jgi:hypothetical protein
MHYMNVVEAGWGVHAPAAGQARLPLHRGARRLPPAIEPREETRDTRCRVYGSKVKLRNVAVHELAAGTYLVLDASSLKIELARTSRSAANRSK